jgi:hypothetical protein
VRGALARPRRGRPAVAEPGALPAARRHPRPPSVFGARGARARTPGRAEDAARELEVAAVLGTRAAGRRAAGPRRVLAAQAAETRRAPTLSRRLRRSRSRLRSPYEAAGRVVRPRGCCASRAARGRSPSARPRRASAARDRVAGPGRRRWRHASGGAAAARPGPLQRRDRGSAGAQRPHRRLTIASIYSKARPAGPRARPRPRALTHRS